MSPPTPADYPTPIVLIGCAARIGKFVVGKMAPEYEVVHFISDVPQAKNDLPVLMSGGEPPHDPNRVSSHNFSQLPRHIVFARGFGPSLPEVRELPGVKDWGCSWYWAPRPPGDLPVEAPVVCELTDETIDYRTDIIANNMKRVLGEVINDGKEGVDGVYEL